MVDTGKYIDKICCIILAATLTITLLLINAGRSGIQTVSASPVTMGYASRLFNSSKVHTLNIAMNDWDSFMANCTNEEYAACDVTIDGETYRNVAIRAKGNTSLSSVQAYGNNRYSFKIEFDHYDDALNYYGLDKLCLNNIIQDNTYMKDYLTYRLMYEFGVDAPLCSYTYITVNGEEWGLYLAVEGIEESFLKRNYGNDYGQLYKPDDSDSNNALQHNQESVPDIKPDVVPGTGKNTASIPNRDNHDTSPAQRQEQFPGGGTPFERNMKSSDVSLIYTDDEQESYSNIFDNAKTDITNSDKTRLIESLKKLNNMEDLENTVDIEKVIRYFVIHNFVLNFDSYTGPLLHNYYLYEKDGKFSMIPWDYNLAFGGFESGSDAAGLVNYPIDTPVSGGTTDSRPMLAWIFNNEKYTDLYHQYFEAFLTEYFDNGYFESIIDSVSALIAPYVQSDPTKFCSYEEFEKGVSALRSFCLLRASSIHGQLSGTIPSTSDGQAQNASSLIDAAGLVISDMGSMGNSFKDRPGFGPPSDESHGTFPPKPFSE